MEKRVKVLVGVFVMAGWSTASLISQGNAQVAAQAQEKSFGPPNRVEVEKQLIERERAHVVGFAKGQVAVGTAAGIAPDAIALDWTGITRASEFKRLAAEIKTESASIDSTQVVWASPQVAVVIYRWTGRATFQGRPVPSPMWVTTTYVNRGGNWVGIIHEYSGGGPCPDPIGPIK